MPKDAEDILESRAFSSILPVTPPCDRRTPNAQTERSKSHLILAICVSYRGQVVTDPHTMPLMFAWWASAAVLANALLSRKSGSSPAHPNRRWLKLLRAFASFLLNCSCSL